MYLKIKKIVAVIWLMILCIGVQTFEPILALAQENTVRICVNNGEYELFTPPTEDNLGIMVNAEEITSTFGYEYDFDIENKSFTIYAGAYGKVMLMHKATTFASGDYVFDCQPYFYVTNGVPMVEIGFYCSMFDMEYDYDKESRIIDIHPIIYGADENTVALMSETDEETETETEHISEPFNISGTVSLPQGFEYTTNVKVKINIVRCTAPYETYRSSYSGGGSWVKVIGIGDKVNIGTLNFTDSIMSLDYNYDVPELKDIDKYPYYVLTYEVIKDRTMLLSRNGRYIGNGVAEGYSFGSSSVSVPRILLGEDQEISFSINQSTSYGGVTTDRYATSKAYKLIIRDVEKDNYFKDNYFSVTDDDNTWETDSHGIVKVEKDYGYITVSADGYIPVKYNDYTRYFKTSGNNRLMMYKTDYSEQPTINAAYVINYIGNGSSYRSVFGEGYDYTYYPGSKTKSSVIAIISCRGSELKSAKIVQDSREVPADISYTDAGTVDGVTYKTAYVRSKEFTPGLDFATLNKPIYLVVTTESGKQVKTRLKMKCIQNPDDKIDIDLGEKIEFMTETDKDDKTILGETNLSYDFFDFLPISVSVQPKPDGKYEFKALVGIGSSSESDSMYENIKDQCIAEFSKDKYAPVPDDAYVYEDEEKKSDLEKFDDFFKKLHDKDASDPSRVPSAEIGKKVSVKLYGYLEGEYGVDSLTSAQWKLNEGGFQAKMGFNYDVKRQTFFATPAGPVPVYWKAGWSLSDLLKVPLVGESGKASSTWQASNTASTSIKGGGGVGIVGMANVGASGEAKLTAKMKIPMFDNDDLTVKLNGKINLLDYELGIIEGSVFTFDVLDLQIYPKFELQSVDETPEEYDAPKQLSRAYVEEPMLFSSGEKVELMSVEAIKQGTVADNCYPFSKPTVTADNDGNLIMAWVEDERSRENDADRTAIYYSIYNSVSKTWSEPSIVYDDKTADFEPKIKNVNGNIYLTWLNATEGIDKNETDYTNISKNLEVAVAIYKDGSFTSLGNVGKSAILHAIGEENDKPVLVWTEDGSGDILANSGKIAVKKAVYDTDEWQEETLLTNQDYIDGLTVYDDISGSVRIVYSKDTDKNLETSEDKELFEIADGVEKQLTFNSVPDTKPTTENGTIYWCRNNTIAYCPIGEDGFDADDMDNIEIETLSDSFDVASSGSQTILTYMARNDEGKNAIYVITDDDGEFAYPIEIATTDNYIASFAAAYGNKEWTVFTDEIDLTDNSIGKASINTYSFGTYRDVALENVYFDNYSLYSTGAKINCDIVNYGMTSEYATVEVQDEGGNRLTYQNFGPIAPGEKYEASVGVYSYNAKNFKNLRLVVNKNNKYDVDTTNNEATFKINIDDISVENVVSDISEEKAVISASIYNRGWNTLDNINVHLRKDSADGEIIESRVVDSVESSDYQYVEFEIPKDIGADVVYVTCDCLEDENMTVNNSAKAYLMSDESQNIEPVEVTDAEDEIEIRSISAESVYLSIPQSLYEKNTFSFKTSYTSWSSHHGKLLCAWYDSDNRLLSMDFGDAATYKTFYNYGDKSNVKYVKIFWWKNFDSMQPLIKAKERIIK